jgi:hypothetical protein
MDLKTQPGQSNQPFRLLDLPTEIQLQIYSHLVVVGRVFYSPNEWTLDNDARFKKWKLYRVPEL